MSTMRVDRLFKVIQVSKNRAISAFRRKCTVCCDIAVIALLLSSSYTLLTCTAFAGGYDGGFYLAVTDDGIGYITR